MMKRFGAFAVTFCFAGLAACASYGPREPDLPLEPAITSAGAEARDTMGRVRAQASVSQIGDSLRVRVDATGMQSGTYAAHIHSVGRCDPPDFTSAGPHWNPTGQQHGKNNPQGMHLGDLPNLMVGADGRGSFEVTIPGVISDRRAPSMLDEDGAALVIHAQADDYRSDPAGNAGGRIACGVFR